MLGPSSGHSLNVFRLFHRSSFKSSHILLNWNLTSIGSKIFGFDAKGSSKGHFSPDLKLILTERNSCEQGTRCRGGDCREQAGTSDQRPATSDQGPRTPSWASTSRPRPDLPRPSGTSSKPMLPRLRLTKRGARVTTVAIVPYRQRG